MAIRRPRRIFRASALTPARSGFPLRPTVLVGTVGVVVGAVVILLSVPGAPLGKLPTLAGDLRAEPNDVAVVDGGTLRLGDAVVRLGGVAAPERGRPCTAADGSQFDCGVAAAQALAGLVRGHDLLCRLEGRDEQGFALARCSAGATDVNTTMVADGWARADGETGGLRDAEHTARDARRGLWASQGF